jgi:hypothetical protein
MGRIAAPTIASEMRANKSPPPAEVGSSGGSSKPVVLGFRDAFVSQKRGGFGA